MPRIVEPLDKGLVTSRNPYQLQPGELTRASDMYYQPNDPSLHVAPGPLGTTTVGATPTGLAHCIFDYVKATVNLTRSSAVVTVVPVVINGVTTTSGSPTITAPTTNNFTNILKGATIVGTGIPASTTVVSVDSPTQITMSANATANGTPDLTFTNAKFANVTAGAKVIGNGIPDGATVLTVNSNTQITLATGKEATITTPSVIYVEADALLIVQANGKYQKAKTGQTGTTLTFSDLETGITEGTDLESIHYNNVHVLLNGKHPNRVLTADGITRPHGLLPVTTDCAPTVVAGAWALKDGTGFYAYWTTEYDANNDIESDFNLGVDADNKARKPPIVEITNVATQAVRVTRPPRVNPTATHWRIYRSIKYASTTAKSAAKENRFPNGFLIGHIELRDDNQQQTFTDGGGLTTTSAVNAGTATTGTGKSGTSWVNPNLATGASNNGGATDDTQSATLTYASGGTTDTASVLLELGGFSIPAVSSPISGITITVVGRRVGNGSLVVKPEVKGIGGEPPTSPTLPLPPSGTRSVPLTTSNASYVLGSSADKWFREWSTSDFANGKFFIRLYGTVTRSGDKVAVDAVSVTVSYGETQDSVTGAFLGTVTDPFPGVTVAPFGFLISAGRGGHPPRASTGDIFQDSLVLNDVENRTLVRYSFQTRIDSFPAPYFLNFDTKNQDQVTFIRTVGNVCIVGLKNQLYRINFLPRDTDSEFERGRAVEVLERTHGIPSASTGVLFTLPGHGLLLAYANPYGIFMTDGFRVRPLTEDIDWWATIDPTSVKDGFFITNPELHLLEFYFPSSGSAPSQKLVFHYHPSHLKEGRLGPTLKVTGPTVALYQRGTLATFPDGSTKVYLGSNSGNNKIDYLTRLGGNTPIGTVITRRIMPTGPGNESRLHEILIGYTLRDDYVGDADRLQAFLSTYKTGDNDVPVTQQKNTGIAALVGSGSTEPRRYRTAKVITPSQGQAFSVRLQSQALGGINRPRISFDYIVLDIEPLGLENPT